MAEAFLDDAAHSIRVGPLCEQAVYAQEKGLDRAMADDKMQISQEWRWADVRADLAPNCSVERCCVFLSFYEINRRCKF